MTELRVRVHKYLDADERGGPPPTVMAQVYAIDPSSGQRVRGGLSRRELVPISHDPQQHRRLDVPAGRYSVEVAMPTGELLTDQVLASEGKPVDVVLTAEDSSNEWMSWQHLAGNVLNAPALLAKAASLAPPPPGTAGGRSASPKAKGGTAKLSKRASGKMGKKDAGGSRGWMGIDMSGAGGTAGAVQEPPAFTVPQQIQWLRTPFPALLPDLPGDPWKELVSLAELPVDDVVLKLNGGNPPVPVPAIVSASDRAVFRVVHGNQGVSSAMPLDSGLPRNFIAVPLGTSVELISVPAPWMSLATFREAVIELAVQRPGEPRDFASSITVRDEQLAILLGFLSTGALTAVREIAEPAMEMLYGKMQNPIAAAAGGYALVATATDTKDHPWHQWIENLHNSFKHVPDGAIQMAMLRLRLRRTPGDLDVARESVKQAYRRGIPYYTMGLRWLLESLEKLCGSDVEMNAMREQVQRVALRSHQQSPFTILRFGRGA